jgi:lysophospholipid acyltransferase (LPLAT)-like uncharacterized protein
VTSPPKQRSAFSLKTKRTMPTWLAAPVARLVNLWGMSCQVKVVDPHGGFGPSRFPVIYAIWHNRILLLPSLMGRDARHRIAALISASRDGNYGAALFRHVGLKPVRGSSSQGGMRALRILLRELDDGNATAVTLDGPRGPRYEVQPGVVLLARKSGVPIVPVSLNAPCRWQLRSWDQTQIPKPFSRVELRVGDPVHFPADEKVDLAAAKRRLRQAMLEVTRDRRA